MSKNPITLLCAILIIAVILISPLHAQTEISADDAPIEQPVQPVQEDDVALQRDAEEYSKDRDLN